MECVKHEKGSVVTLTTPTFCKWFYKVSAEYDVPQEMYEEKRMNIAKDKISIVFPLFFKTTEQMKRVECETAEKEANVYAYLPTMMYSELPFYINANFVQPASREFIMSPDNSQWNHWLLSKIHFAWFRTFHQLLDEKDKNIQFLCYKFIPLIGMKQRDEVRQEKERKEKERADKERAYRRSDLFSRKRANFSKDWNFEDQNKRGEEEDEGDYEEEEEEEEGDEGEEEEEGGGEDGDGEGEEEEEEEVDDQGWSKLPVFKRNRNPSRLLKAVKARMAHINNMLEDAWGRDGREPKQAAKKPVKKVLKKPAQNKSKLWALERVQAPDEDGDLLVEVEDVHRNEEIQAQVDFIEIAKRIRKMLRGTAVVRCGCCDSLHKPTDSVRIVNPKFIELLQNRGKRNGKNVTGEENKEMEDERESKTIQYNIHFVPLQLARFSVPLRAIGVKKMSVVETITTFLQQEGFYEGRSQSWFVALYTYLSGLTYDTEARIIMIDHKTRSLLLPTEIIGNTATADSEIVYFSPSASITQDGLPATMGYCFLLPDISKKLRRPENIQAREWLERVFDIKTFSVVKHKKRILKILNDQVELPTPSIPIPRVIELTRSLFLYFQEDNIGYTIPALVDRKGNLGRTESASFLENGKKVHVLMPHKLSRLWPKLFLEHHLTEYHVLSDDYIRSGDDHEAWRSFLKIMFGAKDNPLPKKVTQWANAGKALQDKINEKFDEKRKEKWKERIETKYRVTRITTYDSLVWPRKDPKGKVTPEDRARAQCMVDWIHYFKEGEGKREVQLTQFLGDLLDTCVEYTTKGPSTKVCRYWLHRNCKFDNMEAKCPREHAELLVQQEHTMIIPYSAMRMDLESLHWIPTTRNTLSNISSLVHEKNKTLYGNLFVYPTIQISDTAAEFLKLCDTPTSAILVKRLTEPALTDFSVIASLYKGLAMKTGDEKAELMAILEMAHPPFKMIFIKDHEGKPTAVLNGAHIFFDNDAKSVTARNYVYLKDLYDEELENFFVEILHVKRRVSYKKLVEDISSLGIGGDDYCLKLIPLLEQRYGGKECEKKLVHFKKMAVNVPVKTLVDLDMCIWEEFPGLLGPFNHVFGFLSLNYPAAYKDFFLKKLGVKETFDIPQLLRALEGLSGRTVSEELVFGIYSALASICTNEDNLRDNFCNWPLIYIPYERKWVSLARCTWDDFEKDFHGEMYCLANIYSDFSQFFLNVVHVPYQPHQFQLVDLWQQIAKEWKGENRAMNVLPRPKDQIDDLIGSIFYWLSQCEDFEGYLKTSRMNVNAPPMQVWTTRGNFMLTHGPMWTEDEELPAMFRKHAFVYRGNLNTHEYGSLCRALSCPHVSSHMTVEPEIRGSAPPKQVFLTDSLKTILFTKFYNKYPDTLENKAAANMLQGFMAAEERTLDSLKIVYRVAATKDTHYQPAEAFYYYHPKKSMFYTTKRVEKSLAAAALAKFVCQIFWAADQAEREEWFSWFSGRVQMTERQLAKEVERNRDGDVAITPEVEGAIRKFAGNNFHIPLRPAKFGQNRVHEVVEENAEMEEAPQGNSDSEDTVDTDEKKFVVAYPKEQEKKEKEGKDKSDTNHMKNRERKPRHDGGPHNHSHNKEKYSDHRPAHPHLSILVRDVDLPESKVPDEIIQRIKDLEAKKGRFTTLPADPGLHLISSAEVQEMEDEEDEDGYEDEEDEEDMGKKRKERREPERDRFIVIKFLKDWSKGVGLSYNEYLASEKYGKDFVLYVVTDGEVHVLEDIQSEITWMAFPNAWHDEGEKFLFPNV
eukprot:Phypoly_transcript_00174.p1 GENE.Phypoly_transcript_00174~~Phypoly_transcript_00174.p1  ORF type:complete len:1770 (+),score=337.77 Phypoly_transcript_00174:874-6183(+)